MTCISNRVELDVLECTYEFSLASPFPVPVSEGKQCLASRLISILIALSLLFL